MILTSRNWLSFFLFGGGGGLIKPPACPFFFAEIKN